MGEDLTEEEKCVSFMDDHNARADDVSCTLDFTREMLSTFEIGRSVSALDTVVSLDPVAVLSTACVILSAASNVASLKFPDMTMHKVLSSLERIEGSLNIILEAPLKKAIDTFDFILKAVRSGSFESAYKKMEKLIDNAETAFHYADKNKLSVKCYRECAKAVRLLMFGHILNESYDNERKIFITQNQLQANKVTLIGETLEMIARKCIEQKENVKTSSWGLESDNKKSEAQDILDSILKFAYPYVSMAKKLNNMNNQLTIQDSFSGYLCVCVLPDLLPMGKDDGDGTQVTFGYPVNTQLSSSDGQMKNAVKVELWRERDTVWCAYENYKSSAIIESETEEVVIKVPLYPGPFTLRATGLPVEELRSGSLCDYLITEEDHRGRPVYSNSKGYNIFTLEDGYWGVSLRVGNSKPLMRSTRPASSPALCQHWLYRDDEDGKYKPGVISVECASFSKE